MNLENWIRSDEKKIELDDEKLVYMGRIAKQEDGLLWVFPCTCVRVHFTGKRLRAIVTNIRDYWTNYLGVIVDGEQSKLALASDREAHEYTLFEGEEGEHDLLLFKRQDACHNMILHGLLVDEEATLLPATPLPTRRMEVYGDSVSAGEVSEAVHRVGMSDPEHDGEYSNSWYSYSWLTARALGAQLHDIAQGGAALLDKTGWFLGPNYRGMESFYDKQTYNRDICEDTPWDFKRYTPHVVVIGLGQNDANPEDYMKEDPNSEKSLHWKAEYRRFIETILEKYPKATVILGTTILRHHPSWDEAIDSVAKSLQAEGKKVHHFLYSKNGDGTDGHIRISEAEKMAEELSAFIESLGAGIWEE